MKVTKKTEAVYEIEFDSTEVKSLDFIRKVYKVSAESFVELSLENSFAEGLTNSENLLEELETEMDGIDGNSGTNWKPRWSLLHVLE